MTERFRYRYHDWFAELDSDCLELRSELNDFFEVKIRTVFRDHPIIGIDSKKQRIYHICYDCNIELWEEIFDRVVKIAKKCHVNLDWQEIKYFLKFTFIFMESGGNIAPHIAQRLPSLSAFNIPLRGRNIISFYSRTSNNTAGRNLETYEYKNPNFLNVNKFHGVSNECEEERLILKSHLTIVPWNKLLESYRSREPVKIFDFEVSWKRKYPVGVKKYCPEEK